LGRILINVEKLISIINLIFMILLIKFGLGRKWTEHSVIGMHVRGEREPQRKAYPLGQKHPGSLLIVPLGKILGPQKNGSVMFFMNCCAFT
jgi:hypothetical protein